LIDDDVANNAAIEIIVNPIAPKIGLAVSAKAKSLASITLSTSKLPKTATANAVYSTIVIAIEIKIALIKFFPGLTISSAVFVIILNPSYEKKVIARLKSILLDERYKAGAINSGFILIKPAVANATNIVMVIIIATF